MSNLIRRNQLAKEQSGFPSDPTINTNITPTVSTSTSTTQSFPTTSTNTINVAFNNTNSWFNAWDDSATSGFQTPTFTPSTLVQAGGRIGAPDASGGTWTGTHYITAGGVALQLTAIMDTMTGKAVYKEIGTGVDVFGFERANNPNYRLPVYNALHYWGENQGFMRTTTGKYIPTSNLIGPNAPTAQNLMPTISFSENDFKVIMKNPIAKSVFQYGNQEGLQLMSYYGVNAGIEKIMQNSNILSNLFTPAHTIVAGQLAGYGQVASWNPPPMTISSPSNLV